MNPQLSASPEGLDPKLSALDITKQTCRNITNLAMGLLVIGGGLTACTKAEAANTDSKGGYSELGPNVKHSSTTLVAENSGRTIVDAGTGQIKLTPAAYTTTPERLSSDAIFSELEGIIRTNMQGEKQEEWLYYISEFKNDSTIGLNGEYLIAELGPNAGRFIDILGKLPSTQFDEVYTLVDSSQAELNLKKSESDRLYSEKLLSSLK